VLAKGDDIEDRLIEFAVRIIRVSQSLPDTSAGQYIKGQLLRSWTSPAANYAEGRNAESSPALRLAAMTLSTSCVSSQKSSTKLESG